jgi:hypothetical protein
MNKGQNGRKQILKGRFRRPLNGNLEAAVGTMAKRGILRRAARLAVAKQFAQGVPAVWMEDGVIYKVYPDGRKVKLASAKRSAVKISQRRFYIQK